MKIHSAKLMWWKKKKKRKKKSMTLFPYLWKGKRWGGRKKNWIANHSARWGIWNIWIIDISHVITKHSTFFTRIYISDWRRINFQSGCCDACLCALSYTRAYNKYWIRFRTTDYHHFRPSKLDEIRNFITSIVATLLSDEYIIGYFLFSRIDTNLTILQPSFSTYAQFLFPNVM